MTSYEILLKCGYSPERAAEISHTPKSEVVTRLADANERKYSSIPDSDMDWWKRKHGNGVYAEIASGSNNGECLTRRGTYRKLRTGDGRIAPSAI